MGVIGFGGLISIVVLYENAIATALAPRRQMTSLADQPELVGFFSYSREDDDDSAGALSALRDRIQRELASQLGRSRHDFRLWQDTAAIAHGKLWETEIAGAIAQSVFFIPIVTPRALKSRHCAFEFQAFLKREAELSRQDLLFPLLYIEVPQLTQEEDRYQSYVRQIIHARQYADWTDFRQDDISSTRTRQQIERFCKDIAFALRVPCEAPAGQVQQDSPHPLDARAIRGVEAELSTGRPPAPRRISLSNAYDADLPRKRVGVHLRMASAVAISVAALTLCTWLFFDLYVDDPLNSREVIGAITFWTTTAALVLLAYSGLKRNN